MTTGMRCYRKHSQIRLYLPVTEHLGESDNNLVFDDNDGRDPWCSECTFSSRRVGRE